MRNQHTFCLLATLLACLFLNACSGNLRSGSSSSPLEDETWPARLTLKQFSERQSDGSYRFGLRYQQTNKKPFINAEYTSIQRISPSCLLIQQDKDDNMQVWRIAEVVDPDSKPWNHHKYTVVSRRDVPYSNSGEVETLQKNNNRSLANSLFAQVFYPTQSANNSLKSDILNRYCEPLITIDKGISQKTRSYQVGEHLVINDMDEDGLSVARVYNLQGQLAAPAFPAVQKLQYYTNRYWVGSGGRPYQATPTVLVIDTGMRTPDNKILYSPFDLDTGLPVLSKTIIGWEPIGRHKDKFRLWKIHHKTDQGVRYSLRSPDGAMDTGAIYKALQNMQDPVSRHTNYYVAQQEDDKWISFYAKLPDNAGLGDWHTVSAINNPQPDVKTLLQVHRHQATQADEKQARIAKQIRDGNIANLESEFSRGPEAWNAFTTYTLARALGGSYAVRHIDMAMQSGKRDWYVDLPYLQWAATQLANAEGVSDQDISRINDYYRRMKTGIAAALQKREEEERRHREYLNEQRRQDIINQGNASYTTPATTRSWKGYRDIYAESDARSAATRKYTESLQRYNSGQQDWHYVR